MNCIPNLILRSLIWLAQGGSTLPPPPSETTRLAWKGLQTPLFCDDLFSAVPEDGELPLQQWQCIPGTLKLQEKAKFLIPADGGMRIALNHSLQAETNCLLQDASVILLTHQDKPISQCRQLLVSPELFRLTDPIPCISRKAALIEELLSLPDCHLRLLLRFLTDIRTATALLPYICCLFSQAWERQDMPSFPVLESVTSQQEDAWILMSLCCPPDLSENRSSCVLLTLWAVLHSCSAWSHEGLARALIKADLQDIAEFPGCLSRLLTASGAAELSEALLSHSICATQDWPDLQPQLYGLLQMSLPLQHTSLTKICDALFNRDPPDSIEFRQLELVLEGGNRDAFTAFLEDRFRETFSADQYHYLPVLAAIRLIRLRQTGADVFSACERQLLQNQHTGDDLVAAQMLIRHLQQDTHRFAHHRDPLTLSDEADVIRVLHRWLQKPGSVYFQTACALCRQLYLRSALTGQDFLDPAILRTACDCWESDRASVLQLLSILPIPSDLPSVPGLSSLAEALKTAFDQLAESPEPWDIIPIFRSCAALKGWTQAELYRAYRRLLCCLDRYKGGLVPDQQEYIRNLKEEMLQLLLSESPSDSTSDILFSELFRSLTPSERRDIDNILRRESNTITRQEDAVLILRHFRNSLQHGKRMPISQKLLSRFSFAVENSSTCLITEWFYALCFLGLSDKAVEHYNAFASVLNHPWRYTPEALGISAVHEHAVFWTTQSRLVQGAAIAAALGMEETLHALLPRMDTSGDYQDQLLHMLQEAQKNGSNPEILHTSFPFINYSRRKIPLLDYWYLYYDDLKLTSLLLRNDPRSHGTILNFGYCGMIPMVLTAVSACADSVCYCSARLLKNNDICTAAMTASCRVLHLLRGSVVEDRELVLGLIRKQNLILSLYNATDWLRDDPEFVSEAVKHYPQEFSLISPRLKKDKRIVIAALRHAAAKTFSSYWPEQILLTMDPQLLEDPEVMVTAVMLRPELAALAKGSAKEHPRLKALVVQSTGSLTNIGNSSKE